MAASAKAGGSQAFDGAENDENLTMPGLIAQAQKYHEELMVKPPKDAQESLDNIRERINDLEGIMKRLLDNAKKELNAKYQQLCQGALDTSLTAKQVMELRDQLGAIVNRFGHSESKMYGIVMKRIEGFEGLSKAHVEGWKDDVLQDLDIILNQAFEQLRRNPVQED